MSWSRKTSAVRWEYIDQSCGNFCPTSAFVSTFSGRFQSHSKHYYLTTIVPILMKNEAVRVLQKRKKIILETWIKYQLADNTLREDLMSNEDLRNQSDELLNAFLAGLSEENVDDAQSASFEPVFEILSG